MDYRYEEEDNSRYEEEDNSQYEDKDSTESEEDNGIRYEEDDENTIDNKEQDEHAIRLATTYIDSYPVSGQPFTWVEGRINNKTYRLNPKKILAAALDHAPTQCGKINIAKAIVNKGSVGDDISNVGIEAFARQIIWNLLVPS